MEFIWQQNLGSQHCALQEAATDEWNFGRFARQSGGIHVDTALRRVLFQVGAQFRPQKLAQRDAVQDQSAKVGQEVLQHVVHSVWVGQHVFGRLVPEFLG